MAVIALRDLSIAATRRAVKYTRLTVYPPDGRVTLVAPLGTRLEVMRAYAVSRLAWIRRQQARFRAQVRETPRRYVTRETHWLWGRPYLLDVQYVDAKPSVTVDHDHIILSVRPGSDCDRRAAVMDAWQRTQLRAVIPGLIAKWEQRLGVRVARYYLQRMKTRWGSCNYKRAHIRLNTELVKKPPHLLECVIVHELVHLLVPDHGKGFVALMNQHYPNWRDAQAELNALPLGARDT